MQLRPYQEKGISNIREAYRMGLKSPLFVLPTGGGKTVVFCHIATNASARGKRVLILVHRIELVRQTSQALYRNEVRHGVINPKFRPDPSAPVQVASVQTLVRRLDKTQAPDLIIIDEAHHANAGTWAKIIKRFPKALLLGVTATPVRGDGQGLGISSGGFFDAMIEGPQIPELIHNGFLVRPKVYAAVDKIDLSGVRMVKGDYDARQLTERVDRKEITGSAVAHYRKLCAGKPAVVFCASVAHAQHVAEEFRKAGFRAYHADGTLDDETRTRILNGLGNGTVDVVTSCDLISEGTDIPAITAAILLRPTQSLSLFIQQVGRALRPLPGKNEAYILDHVGNCITHGLPDEPREWSLDGEARKKKKKNDESTIRVKQCDKCYAVHSPAPVCPNCGHTYEAAKKPPKQVEGELQELTAAHKEALKKQKAAEVGRAKTLEELIAIGKKRGYKEGWAKYVWKSRESRNSNVI